MGSVGVSKIGVDKRTLSKRVRLPKPTILESFDSASGWSPNGLTLEVDAVNKVQGAAALKFVYNGIQYGAATKSNIGKYDFTKAGGTTLAWHQRYPMDGAAARNGSGFRIAQSGSFPGSSSIYDGGGLIMGGAGTACTPRKCRIWPR